VRQIGILSLAEHPDNLLMWFALSANHTGFVIEFDETHPFFTSADTNLKESCLILQKVE